MRLSWNEVRARAAKFVRDHAGDTDELAQALRFWIDFFQVLWVDSRRRLGPQSYPAPPSLGQAAGT